MIWYTLFYCENDKYSGSGSWGF